MDAHAGSVGVHVEAPLFHVDANGGAEHMARKAGVTFLGRLPFDPQLGRAAEEGRSLLPISDLESEGLNMDNNGHHDSSNDNEMNGREGRVGGGAGAEGKRGSDGVDGRVEASASSRCLKELIGKVTGIVERRKKERGAARG